LTEEYKSIYRELSRIRVCMDENPIKAKQLLTNLLNKMMERHWK